MPYEEVKKQKIVKYLNNRIDKAILCDIQRETINKFFHL